MILDDFRVHVQSVEPDWYRISMTKSDEMSFVLSALPSNFASYQFNRQSMSFIVQSAAAVAPVGSSVST